MEEMRIFIKTFEVSELLNGAEMPQKNLASTF